MPGDLCPCSKRLDQIHPLPQKGTKYPIEKIKHSENQCDGSWDKREKELSR